MGLNIGIDVKTQSTGYGELGRNPTDEEAEAAWSALVATFGGAVGGGGVRHRKGYGDGQDWFVFDVRVFGYGRELEAKGFTQADVFKALLAMAVDLFGTDDMEVKTWWSG